MATVLPATSLGPLPKAFSAKDISLLQKQSKRSQADFLNPSPPNPSLGFLPAVRGPAVSKNYNDVTNMFMNQGITKQMKLESKMARHKNNVDLSIMRSLNSKFNVNKKPTLEEATKIYNESRLDKDYFKTHNVPRELATMVAEMYLKANLVIPTDLKQYANSLSDSNSASKRESYLKDIPSLTFDEVKPLRNQILSDPGLNPEDRDILFKTIEGNMPTKPDEPPTSIIQQIKTRIRNETGYARLILDRYSALAMPSNINLVSTKALKLVDLATLNAILAL
jgi:hypothetical protein